MYNTVTNPFYFIKRFNDHYGHQEGDRCLILVANALSATIYEYDGSIGRYGGEEFIVLAHMEAQEQVAEFAEVVRQTLLSAGMDDLDLDRLAASVTLPDGLRLTFRRWLAGSPIAARP
jgi:diguanylate cyclase (GGDEF)-like protein